MRGIGAGVVPGVEVEARLEVQAGLPERANEVGVRRRRRPLRDARQRLSI